MRLEKDVQINVDESTTKTYRVFELKPMDVVKIHEEGKDLLAMLREGLPLASNIDLDEFLDLFPNEQEKLFEAFKEVNAPFLKAARNLGLTSILEEGKTLLVSEFKNSVAASLKAGMSDPGTTASLSSSGPPKRTTPSGESMND